MLTPCELDACLNRIQTDQKTVADIDCIRRLQFAHAMHIPFENINSLLGFPVLLDPSSLMKKLVYEKRGGYCFEQNLLMASVLETAGFSVLKLAARPLWHLPAGELPDPLVTGLPRSHILLLVEVENTEWLVDVGFGGFTPLGPIALHVNEEQCVIHDTFRIITHRQGYILQAIVKGQWKSMYVFDRQQQQQADLEMMNYWVNTSSESRFTQSLVCTMAYSKGRNALMNTAMTSYDWQGNAQKTEFQNADEILQVLDTDFGIDLSDNEKLKQKIQLLIEAENAA